MRLLVKMLPHDLPVFLRKRILLELFAATAGAFECPAPAVSHLNYEGCLRTYALFTRDQSEKALRSGRDVEVIRTRLFQNALPLGAKLHKWAGATSLAEVMKLGQILYNAIGVEIEGDRQGEMTVKHCYFSQYYSAQGCALISALDDGIFSGLSGGYGITFSERITEGRTFCMAKLLMMERAT